MSTHIPKEGSKPYALLRLLLEGQRVDPFLALMELNMPTVHARVSELRRKGWPIRSVKLPHPKLKDETIVSYFLDTHFRRWIAQNADKHPSEYSGREGRGKFWHWTKEDHELD